jgi:hypothetical protein
MTSHTGIGGALTDSTNVAITITNVGHHGFNTVTGWDFSWHAVAGDFNHDGTTDIVWQNTTAPSANGLWPTGRGLPRCNFRTSRRHTIASGDFNHDGTTDILWERRWSGGQWFSGQPAPGHRDHPNMAGSHVVTGDFSRRHYRYPFRHGSGGLGVWLMNANGQIGATVQLRPCRDGLRS